MNLGNTPFGVAVTTDETKVYITTAFSNNVSVIDTATNTVTAIVPVGPNPCGIAVTPYGKSRYLTNWAAMFP